jgi:archaellum component FlaD/FlaE
LFFVLFLINDVATPPLTPAKALQLADEEEEEEKEEKEREKEKKKGKEKEKRTRTEIQREVKEEDEEEGEEKEKEEEDEAREAESSTKERKEGRKPIKAKYKQFHAHAGNKCAKKLEALLSTPLFRFARVFWFCWFGRGWYLLCLRGSRFLLSLSTLPITLLVL